MLKCKLMLGSISYIKPGMLFFEDRIKYHAEQLRMWERFNEPMEFFRVEIFWDEETERALTTTLNLHSIKVRETCYAGKSRNLILQEFYKSDCDYLILCDDDSVLDPESEGFDFLRNLPKKWAEECMFISFNPYAFIDRPIRKKIIEKRENLSIYPLVKNPMTKGMPIGLYPNIVKYGRQPIWFHESDPSRPNVPAEDAVYLIDLCIAKMPVYEVETIFTYQQDLAHRSSIFGKGSDRELTRKSRMDSLIEHIHKKFPRRPDINSIRKVTMEKNPAVNGKFLTRNVEKGITRFELRELDKT